jgi:predicted nucleic acid-binding protein
MNERSFLDSNILIYTDDQDALQKKSQALELIERLRRNNVGVLSTQVLQEYYAATTRKLGVSISIARRKVELFAHFDLVQINLIEILAAIDLQRLHHFSFWDALIIRCALNSGCARLFTEDLQHGQRIDGLEIINPLK